MDKPDKVQDTKAEVHNQNHMKDGLIDFTSGCLGSFYPNFSVTHFVTCVSF